jgi:hypothetical protein
MRALTGLALGAALVVASPFAASAQSRSDESTTVIEHSSPSYRSYDRAPTGTVIEENKEHVTPGHRDEAPVGANPYSHDLPSTDGSDR